MLSRLFIFLQSITPQHLFTRLMGKIADISWPPFKNALIKLFMLRYPIDLSEACIEDPNAYPTFNQFFTRQLKPELRPIDPHQASIVSPADGSISICAQIKQNQLLQAKNHYFTLEALLGNDQTLAEHFYDGSFMTIYLAPHNYHRVHMPLNGHLLQTTYVPGKLFSVSNLTADYVPNLYSNNERLITLFKTEAGLMAVILVGAMIVGSIQTVWQNAPERSKTIQNKDYSQNNLYLEKGAELSQFKLGSTVILLFEKNAITWLTNLQSQSPLQYGQAIAHIKK